VAVEIDVEGNSTARTGRTLHDLLDSEAQVIAVDIPIGIPEGGRRPADAAARAFVGGRASSVFPTPVRAALEAGTFAEAVEVARERTGKGISQQSFALRKRILEVDTIARHDERVVEVHPEVSFCALAGAPLSYSKHKPEGLAERRALLERAGISVPPRPTGVPEADVLDAAVAAWSARRVATGEARAFPEGHAERIGAIWA
jgi:predicted RNase H-like nuclease